MASAAIHAGMRTRSRRRAKRMSVPVPASRPDGPPEPGDGAGREAVLLSSVWTVITPRPLLR
jgi:hypothetical protein